MWPLKMCEITTCTVQKMDLKANNYIRKWLGLPRSLSSVGLFGRNALQLPLRSILLGYRQEKARLVLELRDSSDPSVQNTKAPVRTGRKWRAELAVDQAISRLKPQEIVGRTQSGRTGLGWGTTPKVWSKATRKERKDLVISEVVRIEEESYQIKALSQRQQGRWTTWEGVISRTVGWADMWKIPQARLSFLIRSTYDTLPSPSNLCLWYGSEESCQLCNAPNPSLQHILSSCKTALTQGRYRWRHDRVLRKLAEILEVRRVEIARERLPPTSRRMIHFVREGGGAPNITQPQRSVLAGSCEWNLRVDLDRQLRFPTEITTTNLRPDIVLWSGTAQAVILAELTVPWEGGMEAAFERKKDRYLDLIAECREGGWSAVSYPVEVGCRGFVGASTQRFLKNMGVTGPKLRKALKDLTEEAEQGSFWLWLRRKDQAWGKHGS